MTSSGALGGAGGVVLSRKSYLGPTPASRPPLAERDAALTTCEAASNAATVSLRRLAMNDRAAVRRRRAEAALNGALASCGVDGKTFDAEDDDGLAMEGSTSVVVSALDEDGRPKGASAKDRGPCWGTGMASHAMRCRALRRASTLRPVPLASPCTRAPPRARAPGRYTDVAGIEAMRRCAARLAQRRVRGPPQKRADAEQASSARHAAHRSLPNSLRALSWIAGTWWRRLTTKGGAADGARACAQEGEEAAATAAAAAAMPNWASCARRRPVFGSVTKSSSRVRLLSAGTRTPIWAPRSSSNGSSARRGRSWRGSPPPVRSPP